MKYNHKKPEIECSQCGSDLTHEDFVDYVNGLPLCWDCWKKKPNNTSSVSG